MAVAIGAAGLMNVALASSLLWSKLLADPLRQAVWAAVGVVWIGSAVLSHSDQRRQGSDPHGPPADDRFPQAVEEYLKGNWFEAECTLRQLLRRRPRDLEAGLMLASLLRHTGRLREAADQLDRLERFDGWQRWAMEIGRERALLERIGNQQAEEQHDGKEDSTG
ncbi:MAG: hypothetical protein ACUVUC_06455 [Thermoguttaceae bacterium]